MTNMMSGMKEEAGVMRVYSRTSNLVLSSFKSRVKAETKMTLRFHGSMFPALGERLTLSVSTSPSSTR